MLVYTESAGVFQPPVYTDLVFCELHAIPHRCTSNVAYTCALEQRTHMHEHACIKAPTHPPEAHMQTHTYTHTCPNTQWNPAHTQLYNTSRLHERMEACSPDPRLFRPLNWSQWDVRAQTTGLTSTSTPMYQRISLRQPDQYPQQQLEAQALM